MNPEQLKQLEDNSKVLESTYKIYGIYSDEILDKILMVYNWLQKIEELKQYRKSGEESLYQLTEMHKYIKHVNDINLQIIIKPAESESFHIKDEYITYSILTFLRTLHDPGKDRGRGGQYGITEKNKYLKMFAKDLYSEYYLRFDSVKLTYNFIIDIFTVAGNSISYSHLKSIIGKKD
jgi:predicted YcjX-like family ATPase